MILDPERRHSLRGMKLRALIAEETGDPGDELVLDGDHCFDGTRLWALASDDTPERALGAAVLRSGSHADAPLTVCFDDVEAAGVAARRAVVLRPVPEIRLIEGIALWSYTLFMTKQVINTSSELLLLADAHTPVRSRLLLE